MPTIFRKTIAPGNRIRVLVVDDSVVIRRLVTHVLEEEPMLEVVGFASNGSIALGRIPQLNPDVITLDIEMPEMDGLEMLRELRKQYPNIRVVMFSTLTERGANMTLQALALGADDYVAKAANVGSLDRSMARLRAELVPKIKQFFLIAGESASIQPNLTGPAQSTGPMQSVGPLRLPGVASKRKVLAIGVSTGGPNALSSLIPGLPATSRYPC